MKINLLLAITNTGLEFEFLKFITSLISTGAIAFFVYKYTTDNHRRTLLNELDSKSEWRKKIMEIAGTYQIKVEHVYQLRSALRFNYKKDPNYVENSKDEKKHDTENKESCFDNESNKELCYFDKMNIVIIKYCEELINKKQRNNELDFNQKEIVRTFCRYLLADHWEKNQNKNLKFKDKRKEAELCVYTLTKFISLYGGIPFKKNNCFYKVYKQARNLLES
ncbi:hypothetical protein [Staphylococcus simulans]|uniref:hypothetical protein n=1 Tax=Staphylococcus simulans TaxID=1286 RepID=UPI000E6853D8|nr:hypothetical protein [Staphylococcus simulans]RIN56343.1 hypothetical protein BU029_00605 [Staphylococcus simulans]UXR49578.1 hypothetical protein MUA28_10535 [Staphylococcus simulans]